MSPSTISGINNKMNKITYDHYVCILQICDIETIKNLRMTSKYHEKICFDHMLKKCAFKFDISMIIHPDVYKKYKNLRYLKTYDLRYIKKFKNLSRLRIDYGFDLLKKDVLPDTLTHLTLGDHYNQPIRDIIPNNLTHLTFGRQFNQPIKDALPDTLTHLKFCGSFDQPIKDPLPSNLTHLIFGHFFNQIIEDQLPANLTYLVLGGRFNQPLKKSLPDRLTHLIFGVILINQ